MKYTVSVYFKDPTRPDQTFNVDFYSHATSVLELFNYKDADTLIQLFPLADLARIEIVQIGA